MRWGAPVCLVYTMINKEQQSIEGSLDIDIEGDLDGEFQAINRSVNEPQTKYDSKNISQEVINVQEEVSIHSK